MSISHFSWCIPRRCLFTLSSENPVGILQFGWIFDIFFLTPACHYNRSKQHLAWISTSKKREIDISSSDHNFFQEGRICNRTSSAETWVYALPYMQKWAKKSSFNYRFWCLRQTSPNVCRLLMAARIAANDSSSLLVWTAVMARRSEQFSIWKRLCYQGPFL